MSGFFIYCLYFCKNIKSRSSNNMKIFIKENNNQWAKASSILKDKLTKNLLAEKNIRGIKHHLSIRKKLKKGNKSLTTVNFK